MRLSSPVVSEDVTNRAHERAEVDSWLSRLEAMPGRGDPEAGRRIFFHSTGSSCAQCHRHDGRGNVVGPDLSLIARQGDSRSLLQSIVTPNRDVAPQFYCTLLELSDDSQFTGILLRSSSTEVYRNNFGQEVTFQKKEIMSRRELRTSLMPTGLLDAFTDEEVRDLLAFLMQAPSTR
jgi:putative heme-binding domain-containing protein